MPRLFFALWPAPPVRAALAAAAAALDLDGGRPVAHANLHLTLAFLGEVAPATAAALCAEDAITEVPPFALAIDAAGWWRTNGAAWLAPRLVPPDLTRLQLALCAQLAARGMTLEARAFAPHVTVARGVRTAPPPRAATVVRWRVADYVLARSDTAAGGARYTIQQRWPLRPSAA